MLGVAIVVVGVVLTLIALVELLNGNDDDFDSGCYA